MLGLFVFVFLASAADASDLKIYGCTEYVCDYDVQVGTNLNIVACGSNQGSSGHIIYQTRSLPSAPCASGSPETRCSYGAFSSCASADAPGKAGSFCDQTCLVASVTPASVSQWSCVTCSTWSFQGAIVAATTSLAACAAIAGATSSTGAFFGYGNVWASGVNGLYCDGTLTGASGSPGGYCVYGLTCTSAASAACDANGVNSVSSSFVSTAHDSSCTDNKLNIYQASSEIQFMSPLVH
jgi:hypothetical protein